MTNSDMPKTIHHGRNVKRFREMLDIKQEALAIELGGDWTQRKVSLLEQKETIEPEILEQVAKALKMPVEAIKNFNEEAAVNIIANTFTDNHGSAISNYAETFSPTIYPIEKLVEALEENKKLYEALLQSERDKNALLERLLTELKK
jgi:transcriptional regulator with XRE-family HTH domain